MVRMTLALCSILLPAVASAQAVSGSQPSMNGPNYSTYAPLFESSALIPPSDTPAMRRQKLKRAQELRAEVDGMLRENGGKLTAKQQSYVQRRANEILNYPPHGRTGRLSIR